jgi:predicted PurR-regulated permease PerM
VEEYGESLPGTATRTDRPMPENVTIQITVRGLLLVLAVVAVVWVLVIFNKLLLILLLSVLLAVGMDPVVNRLERAHVPRALAILLVYVVLLAVLVLSVGLLVPVVVMEFTQLTANLPDLVRRVVEVPSRWILPHVPALRDSLSPDDLARRVGGELGGLAGGAGKFLLGLGAAVSALVISTFLVLVVAFFFAVDARFAPRVIARFFPPSARPTAASLMREMGERLGHWVRAQLLVGLFFGVCFGLGLALMGVPYALSLGVAGGVLELIPYVGGIIVTVLAMLVALTISPLLALGVLVLEVVVANIESHIVYPKLVGDIVGLHPLFIIIALFVGAEAKGVIGALLAVPVAVILQVLFDRFYRFDERGERTVQEARREIASPAVAQGE